MKIGDRVWKKSRKPFKSKLQIATIKGFCINPQSPKQREAATFVEDGSVVDLNQLEKYEN